MGDEHDTGLYTPLHPDQIRVLDLQPSTRLEADLRCSLRTVTLKAWDARIEEDWFEALSYTWGSVKDPQTLYVSGRPTEITVNLFNALRRLRQKRVTRALWVDAVCINQADPLERKIQVANMGEIYAGAERVLIWLGEPKAPRRLDLGILFIRSVWDWLHLYRNGTCGLRGLPFFISGQASAMESALRNTNPRWHTRTWVIQEFARAAHVSVCFGSTSLVVNNEMIYGPPEIVERTAYAARYFNVSNCLNAFLYYDLLGAARLYSLADAVSFSAKMQATDPRDKVYGVLGVVRQAERKLIEIRYDDEVEEVYARATLSCLTADQDCTSLRLVALTCRTTPRLPSWAIDFACTSHLSGDGLDAFSTSGHSHTLQQIRACTKKVPIDDEQFARWQLYVSDISALQDPSFKLDGSGRLLTLSGHEVDRIVRVEPVSSQYDVSDAPEHAANMLRWMRQSCQDAAAYSSDAEPRPRHAAIPLAMHCMLNALEPSDLLRGSPLVFPYELGIEEVLYSAQCHWEFIVNHCELGGAAEMKPPVFETYPRSMRARSLWTYALSSSDGASLIATARAHVGLGPATIAPGDVLIADPGCEYPLVLRRNKDVFSFEGFCEIWGVTSFDIWSNTLEGLHRWRQRFRSHGEFREYCLG